MPSTVINQTERKKEMSAQLMNWTENKRLMDNIWSIFTAEELLTSFLWALHIHTNRKKKKEYLKNERMCILMSHHILYCERSSLSYHIGSQTASFLVLFIPWKINHKNVLFISFALMNLLCIALYWRPLCTFTSVMSEYLHWIIHEKTWPYPIQTLFHLGDK